MSRTRSYPVDVTRVHVPFTPDELEVLRILAAKRACSVQTVIREHTASLIAAHRSALLGD